VKVEEIGDQMKRTLMKKRNSNARNESALEFGTGNSSRNLRPLALGWFCQENPFPPLVVDKWISKVA
jgi:hypothetical protein